MPPFSIVILSLLLSPYDGSEDHNSVLVSNCPIKNKNNVITTSHSNRQFIFTHKLNLHFQLRQQEINVKNSNRNDGVP